MERFTIVDDDRAIEIPGRLSSGWPVRGSQITTDRSRPG